MPVAEGSENRLEPYEDLAAGQHTPRVAWDSQLSFARDVVMLVSAASGKGASIGHQTLWVSSHVAPGEHESNPPHPPHSRNDRGPQRASPEPIGPTTDIELKDKGSESRCGYIPNTKEDSDAQAQKPSPNYVRG
jgi:hypothetical protein